MKLGDLGIPGNLWKLYNSFGINSIFDWQFECLSTTGVLTGRNLVFSAPTSAGKTLVAEIVLAKRCVDSRKKCIFILPYVSVVREKVHYMKKLFAPLNLRVEGFMGGEAPSGGLSVTDIAVCTIEKANSLINRLIADGNLDVIGLIIVDELHMVGDANRGYLLELLLTKIMFILKRTPLMHIQVIGMSATLPNLEVIAEWLGASLFKTDYRPVPLQECLKVGNKICEKFSDEVKEVPVVQLPVDEDLITSLCVETISGGHSVLIFCPTKVRCEKLTITVARGFHYILNNPEEDASLKKFIDSLSKSQSRHKEILHQLKKCPVGLDALLADTLSYCVAYHHAGLTFDERDIIEAGFRSGSVRVLIATSTLSSGVNLPARRVIIRTPIFNGKLLDTLSYSQMAGRAGRKGVDDFGQSILICKPAERQKGELLLTSELKPVRSCLSSMSGTSAALKRAILEIVASGIAKTESDLELYSASTLLMTAGEEEKLSVPTQGTLCSVEATPGGSTVSPLTACVKYLVTYEFITVDKSENGEGFLYPTQLGVAALSSSLPPDQSLQVFAELQKARRCFCLDNELHLVYLVTPIYCYEVSSNIDWLLFMSLYEKLSSSGIRVAELIGVEEAFIAKAIRGKIQPNSASDQRKVSVHKRFYSSLVLLDLVMETPLSQVATKYNVSRGQLQSLQQSAATFAGMITVFCNRLGWRNLGMLLSDFQSRLNFGVQRELVDLVRISVLNAQRARLMFSCGYHTIVQIANSSMDQIEQVLKNRQPFQSKNKADNETEFEVKERLLEGKGIWLVGAKIALSEKEAAELMISEAKQLMLDDLRVMGFKFSASSSSKEVSMLEKSLFANQSTVEVTENASKDVHLKDPQSETDEMETSQSEVAVRSEDVSVRNEVAEIDVNDVQVKVDELEKEESERLVFNMSHGAVAKDETSSEKRRKSRKRVSDSDFDFFPPNRSEVSLNSSTNQGLHADGLNTVNERSFTGAETPVQATRLMPKRISAIMPLHGNLMDKSPVYKSSTPLQEVNNIPIRKPILTGGGNTILSPLTVQNANPKASPVSNLVSQSLENFMAESFGTDNSNENLIPPNRSRNSNISNQSDPDSLVVLDNRKSNDFGSDDSLFSSQMEIDCAQSCVPNKSIEIALRVDDSSDAPDSIFSFGQTKETSLDQSSEILFDRQPSVLDDSLEKRAKSGLNLFEDESAVMDQSHSSFCEEPNAFETSSASLFSIIDVTCSRESFETFAEEALEKDCYSFAFVLKSLDRGVGKTEPFIIPYLDAFVAGISFTWSGYQSHYISLSSLPSDVEQDDSLILQLPETQYSSISSSEILQFLCELFVKPGVTRIANNAKNQMRILLETLDIRINNPVYDPSIANWVANPSLDNSLTQIAVTYLPNVDFADIFPQVCWNAFADAKNSKQFVSSSGRNRASVESVMTFHCYSGVCELLRNEKLYSYFSDIETHVQLVNCELEMNGFGVNEEVFHKLIETCHNRLELLVAEAHRLVGREFDLTNSEEIGFILYFELKLPPNGDPENLKPSSNFQKSLGLNNSKMKYKKRGTALRLPKEYNTSKEILKKLEKFHGLPAVIIEWRKLAFTVHKIISPLRRHFVPSSNSQISRVYSTCDTYSATGRMSFTEPNLQNITKQFSLIALHSPGRRTRRSVANISQSTTSINPREIFVSGRNRVLIAADFSQIELRLFAHFSKDEVLLGFLNGGGDVFKSIAANWKKIKVDEVSDTDRQQAKQLCYGIIYGMGAKSLSDQLDTTVEIAQQFIDSFRKAFPAVYEFVTNTVLECRVDEKVKTLFGRERVLTNVNHHNHHVKSHAERQSVNTIIQGSASEVLKCALVAVRKSMLSAGFITNLMEANSTALKNNECLLVLHVHDEVIYEVSLSRLSEAVEIVRSEMENAVASRVAVKLPVKLKCGYSWGSMVDYDHFTPL